jgi:hypothetical protein
MSDRPALIAGDWNAAPDNPARHRPRWLARRAGLVIASAGPGSHGDIDYPMSDARLSDVRRGQRHGSDHQVVLWTASWPGHQLTMGSWNVLAGRNPHDVADSVAELMERRDVLCLQECGPELDRSMRAIGLRVFGHGPQLVVVRHGVPAAHPRHHRLSTLGWPLDRAGTPRGPWHRPAEASSVQVADSMRVWSVHLPNHERSRWHAAAYAQAVRRLARRVNRRRRR